MATVHRAALLVRQQLQQLPIIVIHTTTTATYLTHLHRPHMIPTAMRRPLLNLILVRNDNVIAKHVEE